MDKILYQKSPNAFKNNPILFSLSIIFGIATVFGLIIPIVWYISVSKNILIIYKEKSIYKTGILSKTSNEVYHQDVRNIQISQSFFQGIFDVSTLQISSAGQADMEISIKGIPEADKAKSIINNHRNIPQNKNNNQSLGTLSNANELQKLAELKENGVITEAEFNAEKKKLLS